MLVEISAATFDEWFDYYMTEPWGYELEIANHAEICTYLVNGLYRPKTLVKPADFYPKDEDEKPRTWQEIQQTLRVSTGG